MNTDTRNLHTRIAGALAVIAVLAIAAYMYVNRSNPSAGQNATSTPVTTTDGVTVSGGTANVTQNPTPSTKAPDFRTPLTFNSSVSADVRTALTAQFDATVKALTANGLDFQAWINLGTVRKMAGDYSGAETDWKYAASMYPKSTVPTDNLGELYLDFLKNYVKAEANFKQSIANDPHDINAYQQLVSLYTTYGYKDTATALALVKKGLAVNPNNQTLLQLQSQLETK